METRTTEGSHSFRLSCKRTYSHALLFRRMSKQIKKLRRVLASEKMNKLHDEKRRVLSGEAELSENMKSILKILKEPNYM